MAETPFYITTPIYYVNDRPHIGHCYTTLLADVAARFMRFADRDVFFLTGTDEHAEKVYAAATEQGMTPIQWSDQNAEAFRQAFSNLGFSHDDFIRTSEDRHERVVVESLKKLQESGDIYLGDYEGWWDPSQEEYVTETTAREHDYKSPVSGRPLERRTERNYFFRLSAYQDRLLEHVEKHPDFLRPEARRNEVVGRVRQGLQDVPISRAVDPNDPASQWGILMPGDPNHRVYVWIDALLNYVSAIRADGRAHYWPAQYHLIGKDILWFHTVIWPCMLMAMGEDLPGCVYAHSYWIREGRKMSKSLGNFLDMPTLAAYRDAYSRDALRWYLTTQGPIGATDADFAYAKFVDVYNAELANCLGNALNRVTNMIGRYFDGRLPDAKGVTHYADHDWPAITSDAIESAIRDAEAMDLPGALHHGLSIARRVDGYIHMTEPFKLAKEETRRDEVAAILYHCAEALRIAGLALWPAMPEKIEQLWRRLGAEVDPARDRVRDLAQWGLLEPGSTVEKGDPLFPRADADAPEPKPAAPAAS